MMKKSIPYSIVFIMLLILWKCQPILKASAAALYSATLPTPEIDSTANEQYPIADFNLVVSDLNGKPVRMENYRGKVIFLNFWATWCLPCVAELPSINKLYLQFKEEDIAFLLISNEDPSKVKRYQEKKNYEVPFMIEDSASVIPQMFYSTGIPTTFIINKDGKVVKASSGAEDWDDKEFVEALKKKL